MTNLHIHNFRECNEWSKQASDEPFWWAIYQKAFPDMIAWEGTESERLQRIGIDRVLTMNNMRQLFIDEKKRKKVYDDILLEYISNDQANTPGWMEKDHPLDYLAYAFMPKQRVYLFDWRMLRRTWLRFADEWIEKGEQKRDGFHIVRALNEGYTTISIAVPIQVLRKAVSAATIIQL